jgi:hypothetical protein
MENTVIITNKEADAVRESIKHMCWYTIEKTETKEVYTGASHIVVLKKVDDGYEYTLINKTYLLKL